jgi:hypothetical protein
MNASGRTTKPKGESDRMNYLRRLTLLAAAAMALIAFAVPAAAQASEPGWIIGGEPVGEEPQSVDVSGHLNFTTLGGVIFWKCQLNGEAQLGSGESEVTSLEITPCLNGAGATVYCTLTENESWGGPLLSSGSTLTMPYFFTLIFSPEGCGSSPEVFAPHGELDGTANGGNCILYDDTITVGPNNNDVKVSGELCFTSPAGDVEFGESPEGPLWYLNGSKLGDKAHAKSFAANTTWKFNTGPMGAIKFSCETVESSGQIWNAGNGGRVGVDQVPFSEGGEWEGCDVFAGATLICEKAGESDMSPMSMFSGGTNALTASELAVHLRFNEGCAMGEETDFGGQLDGQFNNETGCIEYNNAGSLETAAHKAFSTSAQMCPEVAGGGKLTLE